MGRGIVEGIDGYIAGGVTAGAYRVSPWHSTGEVRDSKGTLLGIKRSIDDDPRTVDEIIDIASLNWEPQEVAISDLCPDIVSRTKLLVRDDFPTVGQRYELGRHHDTYGLLSNRSCIEFIAEVLRHRSDASLRSATQLYGGAISFAVVEFRDGVKPTRRNGEQKDFHTPFLGVYWSHNGQYPLGVKYMRREWVCENTFTPWTAHTGLIVRHTRHAETHAAVALSAIEGMMTTMDSLDVEIERLLQIEMDRDAFVQLVQANDLLGQRPEAKVRTLDGKVSTIDNAGLRWDTRFDEIVAEFDEFTDGVSGFDAVMAVQGWEQHRQQVNLGGRDAKNIVRFIRDDFPMTAAAARLVGAR